MPSSFSIALSLGLAALQLTQFHVNKTFMIEKKDRMKEMKKNYRKINQVCFFVATRSFGQN
jgi:hypothetical protein